MQTYRLRYKPFGKCEEVFIEARDEDYAQAVAKKWCEGRRVNMVSVVLNSVAGESILTEGEKEDIETAKRKKEERARPVEVAVVAPVVEPVAGLGKWPAMPVGKAVI